MVVCALLSFYTSTVADERASITAASIWRGGEFVFVPSGAGSEGAASVGSLSLTVTFKLSKGGSRPYQLPLINVNSVSNLMVGQYKSWLLSGLFASCHLYSANDR